MLEVQTMATQGWVVIEGAEMVLAQLRKGTVSSPITRLSVKWASCPVLLRGPFKTKLRVPERSGGEAYHCCTPPLSTDLTMTELGKRGSQSDQEGKASCGACKSLTKVLKWQPEVPEGGREEDNLWSRSKDRWRFLNGGVLQKKAFFFLLSQRHVCFLDVWVFPLKSG